MRERCKIAACADASLRGNDRDRVGIEQPLKGFDD
jgi:hypothetical protein